jgi:hypothetical protein
MEVETIEETEETMPPASAVTTIASQVPPTSPLRHSQVMNSSLSHTHMAPLHAVSCSGMELDEEDDGSSEKENDVPIHPGCLAPKAVREKVANDVEKRFKPTSEKSVILLREFCKLQP